VTPLVAPHHGGPIAVPHVGVLDLGRRPAGVGWRSEARSKIMQIAVGGFQYALNGADGGNDLSVMITGQAWD
jgi:hypothetical protein